MGAAALEGAGTAAVDDPTTGSVAAAPLPDVAPAVAGAACVVTTLLGLAGEASPAPLALGLEETGEEAGGEAALAGAITGFVPSPFTGTSAGTGTAAAGVPFGLALLLVLLDWRELLARGGSGSFKEDAPPASTSATAASAIVCSSIGTAAAGWT